jgi:hypothetical protein
MALGEIRIQKITTADPDPLVNLNADPDPKHCSYPDLWARVFPKILALAVWLEGDVSINLFQGTNMWTKCWPFPFRIAAWSSSRLGG